jgi:hypothetical protein
MATDIITKFGEVDFNNWTYQDFIDWAHAVLQTDNIKKLDEVYELFAKLVGCDVDDLWDLDVEEGLELQRQLEEAINKFAEGKPEDYGYKVRYTNWKMRDYRKFIQLQQNRDTTEVEELLERILEHEGEQVKAPLSAEAGIMGMKAARERTSKILSGKS